MKVLMISLTVKMAIGTASGREVIKAAMQA